MDTPTYVVIVITGIVLTVIVGQILMRAGHGFLQDVFSSEDVATSTTRLLGVLFHLVALGILGTVSTVTPEFMEGLGTVQTFVTRIGLVLLLLGILHGATLLLLARVRNRRRAQGIEEDMTTQYQQRRASRQANRTQVIEGPSSSSGG